MQSALAYEIRCRLRGAGIHQENDLIDAPVLNRIQVQSEESFGRGIDIIDARVRVRGDDGIVD